MKTDWFKRGGEGSGVKHEDLGREKIEKMAIETSEKKIKRGVVWWGELFFSKQIFISQELMGQINGKFWTLTYRDVTL